MSGSEAEQLMAKKRSGYYMIRFSGQQPGRELFELPSLEVAIEP